MLWKLENRFIVEGGNFLKINSNTEERLFIVMAGNCGALSDTTLLAEK